MASLGGSHGRCEPVLSGSPSARSRSTTTPRSSQAERLAYVQEVLCADGAQGHGQWPRGSATWHWPRTPLHGHEKLATRCIRDCSAVGSTSRHDAVLQSMTLCCVWSYRIAQQLCCVIDVRPPAAQRRQPPSARHDPRCARRPAADVGRFIRRFRGAQLSRSACAARQAWLCAARAARTAPVQRSSMRDRERPELGLVVEACPHTPTPPRRRAAHDRRDHCRRCSRRAAMDAGIQQSITKSKL